MTVGCTCHDSLLFSKDLAWCSDTFRLVAGKDHVGNLWKSIVCMLLHASGTCLFRTDILQWKCTRSRSTSAEIQWKQDSIDLEDDEVQAISESEKGACHSWESVQACDDAFTPPFQFLNCWEKHGETVLTQTCQCHTWVKNMNRLQCVSQHFQPCSATKRSWVRRMDL